MRIDGGDISRAGVLAVVLALGQMAAGTIFFRGSPGFASDGPFGAGSALILVALIDAAILTALARNMGLRGWALGLALGSVLFLVQTGLSLIEAIMFNNDLKMSPKLLGATAIAALVRDAIGGIAIALMWRGPGAPGSSLRGLAWKLPAAAFFYLFCYFAAGQLIAWQSAEVRAFYAHIGEIDLAHLAGLQIARGLVWGGLAWLLARSLAGPDWKAALLVGLAFAGLMAPVLLFPNPAMPWPVRWVHMVEIGVSNFLFGLIAAFVLRHGARRKSGSREAEALPA